MNSPFEDAPPEIEGPEGARVTIAGRTYDWFRSNGYLGLSSHPEVLAAACAATLRYGLRLRDKRPVGVHPCLLDLERNAARFFDVDAVALSGSGYSSAAVLLAALGDDHDIVFADAEAHYSGMDAAAMSGKPIVTFAHREPGDLEAKLRDVLRPGDRPLVLTDAMFGATGALAPVPEYVEILQPFEGALLCLDEAHTFGVLGDHGRGAREHFGIKSEGGVTVHSFGTLSKAFGAFGGILPGTRALIKKARDRSRVLRGGSRPPPGIVAAAAKAFEILSRTDSAAPNAPPALGNAGSTPLALDLRRRLADNVRALRTGLSRAGLGVDAASPAPIVSIDRRGGLRMADVCRALFEEGIAVLHMEGGYSGVPEGGALVMAVFATHEAEQIERLIDALRRRA